MTTMSLDRLVFGELRHARMDILRERATRSGLRRNGRHVLEGGTDLLAVTHDLSVPETSEDVERAYWLAVSYIREFANDKLRIALAERTILDGESTTKVSEELGINPSTGRSTVSRIRRKLSGN